MDGLTEFIEWVKQHDDDDLLVAWLQLIDSSYDDGELMYGRHGLH